MRTKSGRAHVFAFTVLILSLLGWSSSAELLRSVSVVDPALQTSAGGTGDSCAPIISPNGRYVLFASTAKNLLLATNGLPIPAPFPARMNVFLRDTTNGTTSLVSVNFSGVAGGNGDSMPTGLSTNGQFALFESTASDLVPNDTNGVSDVFLRDLSSGSNILVSVSLEGTPGNGASSGSVLSGNGRYVAFSSAAANLVADDTNGIPDVFVRDLQLGTTVLVSVGAIGNLANGSDSPEISKDGRYVAFYSTATNLVPGVNTTSEIYVRDLVNGTTTLASANTRTVLSTSYVVSYNHALSADGKFLAYVARSTTGPAITFLFRYGVTTHVMDLVHTNAITSTTPNADRTLDITPDGRYVAFVANTNTAGGTVPAICVWDAQTGATTIASRNITNGIGIGSFEWPSIDASGRYVCFTSTATNLTTNVLSGSHVFVRDMQLNKTILADADTNRVGFDVISSAVPALSANGRFVAFESFADNDSTNPHRFPQVFLRDLQTNLVQLVSVRDAALPSLLPDAPSDVQSFSVNADGRFVAFSSLAANLVTNDNNFNRDIFVRDLLTNSNILVSVGVNGFSAAGMSFEPSISSDGRYVAFTSMATNLVAGDNNKLRDVFAADLQTKAIVLGSVSLNGSVGNSPSYSPTISEGGRYLLFRSTATNLTANVISAGTENLFLRDLLTANTIALTIGGVTNAAMTPDGRFVAFIGRIPSGPTSYLYVWDTTAAKFVYTNTTANLLGVAISPDGNRLAYSFGTNLRGVDRLANTNWQIGVMSFNPRAGLKFSADGRFLVYASSNAETGIDSNSAHDVFLYDFVSKTKTMVSHASDAANTANRASDYPTVSADGRFVAYRSFATNLVPGDANNLSDIFVYDNLTGLNTLLSANSFGGSGDKSSFPPVFAGDGRTLVFGSWASDLIANDFNHVGDLFSFSFLYATVTRGNPGEAPVISWPAFSGGNYQVQFKNSLNDANWQMLNGTITFVGNKAFIEDSSPTADQRIYRVVGF